ncbi:MAG: hypothetical protein Q4B42_03650 [Oscillospiraceae bacterium]|nr:hypothetical protein [Oscillospiraceae bacterium]
MCANEQLLIAIHKTAEMGMLSTEKIMEVSRDEALKRALSDSREEYKRIWMSADTLLKASDGDDKGVSGMAKAMTDMNIELTAASGGSTEKLLEKLSKGNERGLEELERALSEFGGGAYEETVNLAGALRSLLIRERADLDSALEEGAGPLAPEPRGEDSPRDRV